MLAVLIPFIGFVSLSTAMQLFFKASQIASNDRRLATYPSVTSDSSSADHIQI